MKIFYRRLYMKRCIFCHFSARIAKSNNVWWSFAFPNFRKMGKFAVSIEHSEAKSVSASGGRSPLTSLLGALPLDPAGGSAPDSRYRLALRALAMPPPLPNPKYATVRDPTCSKLIVVFFLYNWCVCDFNYTMKHSYISFCQNNTLICHVQCLYCLNRDLKHWWHYQHHTW